MPSDQAVEIGERGGLIVQISGDRNSIEIGRNALRLTRFENRTVGTEGEAVTGTELVAAYSQSIPVIGRDEVEHDLWAWLQRENAPVSVRVLVGPGGRGKTRLALKLCEDAVARGWQAGFLRNQEIIRFQGLQNLSSWRRKHPTLIVIDYAASVAGRIRDWLAELSDPTPDGSPLRVLLLERSAAVDQGWWQSAFGIGGGEATAIHRLLDPAEPVILPEIGLDESRRAILTATLARAGSDLQPPEPGQDPDFDNKLAGTPWAGEPLFLMMAAELAREAGFTRVLSLTRSDVALAIADRERARISQIMAANGVPETFGRHMAAVVTLCQGLDRETAFRAIEREMNALGFDGAANRATVFATLQTVLPVSDNEVSQIVPNIVGEAVLLREWPNADQPAILRCLADRRAGVVQTVIRTCQDYAIQGYATPLGWLDSLGDALSVELPTLLDLLDALPHQTIKLRERAAILTDRAVGMLRKEVDQDSSASNRANLAASLNNLSVRLSDLGHREGALAAIEEAVNIRRALTADRPDVFRPDLATSLNNLSNRLSELGRREDALAAIEETVEIRRALVADRPTPYRPDLAIALNNLSNKLAAIGRLEDALSAIEEAVEIRRYLATERPDTFTPDLATSLNNLSGRLSELGRREDAMAAIEQAVKIRRYLAAERPDAFTPDLATSLNNLSISLSELGRREDALAAIEEAVDIRRRLAADRPEAFRSDLATSLNNLSNRFSDLGRHEDALAAIQEAVDTCRALAADRPDAFSPDLAASLNNLSNRFSDLRLHEEAIAAIQEAVDMYHSLAADRPDAFLPSLARSLNNLSTNLANTGRLSEALETSREATQILRSLKEIHPHVFAADIQPNLVGHVKLSSAFESRGNLDKSKEALDLGLFLISNDDHYSDINKLIKSKIAQLDDSNNERAY